MTWAPLSPVLLVALVLSAGVAFIMSRPGLWGLSGALVYAASQLLVVMSSETAEEPRVMRVAWLRFAIAIFFGAIAAEGFGPTLAEWTHGRVQPQAVWLVVGLSANVAWPVIERTGLSAILRAVGAFFGDGRK